ncbi:MAG: hypothetical protein MRERC_1c149 [Mycoplasmataceae bacterium RC_NB112A]|nr:MAG: hypothetical protein MRERC_1c149 [Mycoplasmataceae bacterium RC_NB112A]
MRESEGRSGVETKKFVIKSNNLTNEVKRNRRSKKLNY